MSKPNRAKKKDDLQCQVFPIRQIKLIIIHNMSNPSTVVAQRLNNPIIPHLIGFYQSVTALVFFLEKDSQGDYADRRQNRGDLVEIVSLQQVKTWGNLDTYDE